MENFLTVVPAKLFYWLSYTISFLFPTFFLFLFWPMESFAQACSMCQSTAAAQSELGIQALNRAIIFLLAPPVGIMSTILIYAFRRSASQKD